METGVVTGDASSTGNLDDESRRLEELSRMLDALPPEMVRQALLDAGAIDVALDVLKDLAQNSKDASVREEAKQVILDRGLGIILWADEDDPPTHD